MDIHLATVDYERWLTRYTPLVQADLDLKHRQMSADLFSFLRATYYRWVQLWPETCAALAEAPVVVAVGDLHVANFGTWRDREGRLCWGINDFDVAHILPYTHDLTRLATSALLAIQQKSLRIDPASACSTILKGYTEVIEGGGKAFVLAEQHGWLRDIAIRNLKKPQVFWPKMDALPDITEPLPITARDALENAMPLPGMPYRVTHRIAGSGSLGLPRYVALAEFEDGRVAREAKAMVPSPEYWANAPHQPVEYLYEAIMHASIRAHDPFTQTHGQWVVRRLAPDCIRVELTALPDMEGEAKLLHAMGKETANVHRGSQQAIPAIHQDLTQRSPDWLYYAAAAMTDVVKQDWEQWQRA